MWNFAIALVLMDEKDIAQHIKREVCPKGAGVDHSY